MAMQDVWDGSHGLDLEPIRDALPEEQRTFIKHMPNIPGGPAALVFQIALGDQVPRLRAARRAPAPTPGHAAAQHDARACASGPREARSSRADRMRFAWLFGHAAHLYERGLRSEASLLQAPRPHQRQGARRPRAGAQARGGPAHCRGEEAQDRGRAPASRPRNASGSSASARKRPSGCSASRRSSPPQGRGHREEEGRRGQEEGRCHREEEGGCGCEEEGGRRQEEGRGHQEEDGRRKEEGHRQEEGGCCQEEGGMPRRRAAKPAKKKAAAKKKVTARKKTKKAKKAARKKTTRRRPAPKKADEEGEGRRPTRKPARKPTRKPKKKTARRPVKKAAKKKTRRKKATRKPCEEGQDQKAQDFAGADLRCGMTPGHPAPAEQAALAGATLLHGGGNRISRRSGLSATVDETPAARPRTGRSRPRARSCERLALRKAAAAEVLAGRPPRVPS